jgi:hypothetical protein
MDTIFPVSWNRKLPLELLRREASAAIGAAETKLTE